MNVEIEAQLKELKSRATHLQRKLKAIAIKTKRSGLARLADWSAKATNFKAHGLRVVNPKA